MSPKKNPSTSAKRHATTLDDKHTMIKRHEKGEKVILIVQSFRMSRTTINLRDINKRM